MPPLRTRFRASLPLEDAHESQARGKSLPVFNLYQDVQLRLQTDQAPENEAWRRCEDQG